MQYFIALCGSRAEQAITQAQHQGCAPHPHTSPVEGEGTLDPAGPDATAPANAATAGHDTSKLRDASSRGIGLAIAATAERDQQEGLSQVHARLQNLLQDLPEPAEPAGQEGASRGSGPAEFKPGPVPVNPRVGQTHKQTQSDAPNNPQPDQFKDQGIDQAGDAPSPAVATTPNSSPKQLQPAGSAADEAATAVEDAIAAEGHEARVSSTVPVVCGSVQGIYDTRRGVVVINGGKAARPNKVEIMAEKGNGKTWAETIQVDQGNGVAGVSLGKWIKDLMKTRRSGARARCRTSPQGKQRTSPAQHAKHSLSSAVVMADGTVQLDDQGFSKAQSLGPHAIGSVLKHVRALLLAVAGCPVQHTFCPFTPRRLFRVSGRGRGAGGFAAQACGGGSASSLLSVFGSAGVWGWEGGSMQGTS